MANDDDYERLLQQFSAKEVPHCPGCGGIDTASVQVGVIGLTLRLAATCRKFKLIGNGPKPGEWFCNDCGSYFDSPAPCAQGKPVDTTPRPTLVRFDFPPGATADEIFKGIEAMRAKYREQRKAKDEP